MITARYVIKKATERTDIKLRSFFAKDMPFIMFKSGRSATIESEITMLTTSCNFNPFPLVAMFTEGMEESMSKNILEFRIPKIAIVVRTKTNTTEEQKLNDSFSAILYPILEEFSLQLERLNFGYKLKIDHTDLPCMSNSGKNASLNQLCDAVIVRNLKMKYFISKC